MLDGLNRASSAPKFYLMYVERTHVKPVESDTCGFKETVQIGLSVVGSIEDIIVVANISFASFSLQLTQNSVFVLAAGDPEGSSGHLDVLGHGAAGPASQRPPNNCRIRRPADFRLCFIKTKNAFCAISCFMPSFVPAQSQSTDLSDLP